MQNAWAIGDIQGCFDEFIELVERIDQHALEHGLSESPKLGWLAI